MVGFNIILGWPVKSQIQGIWWKHKNCISLFGVQEMLACRCWHLFLELGANLEVSWNILISKSKNILLENYFQISNYELFSFN